MATASAPKLPQLDPSSFASQLFWLTVTFIVLYLLMSMVALPRIESVLEKRRKKIAADLNEADALSEEAQAARAEYEHGYAEARSKASLIITETAQSMRATFDEKKKELDREYEDRMEKALAGIAKKREAFQGKLEPVAQEVADSIIRKLVGVTAEEAIIAAAINKKK